MASRQDTRTPYVLANKPSASFSTVSSAGSATSAATSRSGGSKLLFGEIDLTSDRSSESYASVCNFVLCDSGTFLKFWLEDKCRDIFLSYLPKDDLSNVRLACHDFSVRAAPALFADLSISFKTGTFTRPARLAALDRLGFYVKTLHFHVPHTAETFLPPLVEPETGEELSFTYTPQLQAPTAGRPKYGDIGTTEILTRQYPTLFHAATNVPAFVRAFSALINLQHLHISCPGYDTSRSQRRSVVDFALISLRMAVEQNCLNSLESLSLSPIHPGAFSYLSPTLGYGATPRSSKIWSRIQHLGIAMNTPPDAESFTQTAHFKLLQTYIRNFQVNLTTFNFRWLGKKGPLPVQHPPITPCTQIQEHPATRLTESPSDQKKNRRRRSSTLRLPMLKRVDVENVMATAAQINTFVTDHKSTIEELNLEDIELTAGTWDEALAPLTRRARHRTSFAEIPIMLFTGTSPISPTLPSPMERLEPPVGANVRRNLRISRWLSTRKNKPVSARKVREGLQGCEEQLKKVLGGVLSWR